MENKPTYEELEQRIRDLERERNGDKGISQRREDSDQMYRQILENISDTVIITDDQGNMVYACPNTTKIFGLSQEQVYKQKSIQRLINGTVCDIATLKIQKKIENIEWSINDSSGQEHFLLISTKLVNLKGGTVLYVIRDITDRKQSEEELRDSEIRFRTVVDNAADAIFVHHNDERGTILDANRQACKSLGYSREELIGMTPHDFDACLSLSTMEQLEARMNDGEMVAFETLHRRKDGTVFPVEVRARPFWQGARQFAVAMVRDITERKQAEEKLKESEERFRSLFEQGANAIVLLDADSGDIIEFNQRAHEDLGYSREEFEKLSVADIEALESLEDAKAHLDKVLEMGSDIFETKLITRKGNLRDMLISVRMLKVPGKNRLMSIWTDITERKQAEQERLSNVHFLESMDRINRATQETNDLELMMSDALDKVLSIFDCDRAFLLYPCDPEAASWYAPMERTKPEYPGANAEGLEASMDPDVARIYRLLLESDGPVKFGPDSAHPLPREMSSRFGYKSQILMALYPKTGAPWVFGLHQCSYPRVWTQQEEILLQEIGRRLTDGLTSLLMNRKLRDSEEKYRTIMEAFVEPLVICSRDLIIEYMNPAMIHRIGRDATGEKCYTALHGLEAKCDWCVFDEVILDTKCKINIKSPLDDRQYHISSMPIKSKDGTISMMAIYRDITDYVAAISEKEKAQAQLMQAQKMESIGNLAGGIAHDFNNILAAIIGFTELAIDDVEKDSLIENNLQGVYSAAKRAKDLVGQILAFARQREGELKPLQIDVVVKEVLQFIRSSIPTTIAIKSNINSDSYIMGNQTQVHQILMNLFTNAAFAMEENGGVLTVSLKDTIIEKRFREGHIGLNDGDYIELSVSDTGPGIPQDIIDSIFDPYFTTKSPGQGTGMGLAMVHGIVESYEGKITVDSTLGAGTIFTIYLPITRKLQTQRFLKNEQLPTGKERILFVDDEAPIAKIGAHTLERLGYSVTVRTSSLEALELFKTKPTEFDLVITDMTMPNMTGDKLAVELIKVNPDIPIIICTGYSNKISDETASQIGIKAFAYKPVAKADLAKTIRKVLDKTL